MIPTDFPRLLANQQPTDVQVIVDGVDANQAGIAIGYLSRLINDFNRHFRLFNPSLLLLKFGFYITLVW